MESSVYVENFLEACNDKHRCGVGGGRANLEETAEGGGG